MNELQELESLGRVLPTPTHIAGVLLFGLLGYAAFRRGRKASNQALTWSGVALMLYPYLISGSAMLWAVGVALCGLAYANWN